MISEARAFANEARGKYADDVIHPGAILLDVESNGPQLVGFVEMREGRRIIPFLLMNKAVCRMEDAALPVSETGFLHEVLDLGDERGVTFRRAIAREIPRGYDDMATNQAELLIKRLGVRISATAVQTCREMPLHGVVLRHELVEALEVRHRQFRLAGFRVVLSNGQQSRREFRIDRQSFVEERQASSTNVKSR